MTCIKCNEEVPYGLRYCNACIEKEKEEKREQERQQRIKDSEYRKQITELQNKTRLEAKSPTKDNTITVDMMTTESHPTAIITCNASILRQLKEDYRKSKVKTEEEYKVIIQKWIDTECETLDKSLRKAASNGEDSYRVRSELIVNPGVISGKCCYIDWQFLKYLTDLVNPLHIFKQKVGDGITIKCKSCIGFYSGMENPDKPEDIRLEYEFCW